MPGVAAIAEVAVLLWSRYVNQDEPPLKGHSVTVKAGEEQVEHMRMGAAQTFRPEMAQLMQVGPEK